MNYFIFQFMFSVVPIIVVLGFVFVLVSMFSPKVRAWMMGKQIKAVNYTVEDNKEELKNIADSGVDIAGDAISRTVNSVKRGFSDSVSEQTKRTCSYCGSSIDEDSQFCKNCGKKQRAKDDYTL